MMRELFDRAQTKLKENLGKAADTMVSVLENPEVDAKVKIDTAKWLIERIMGKTPDIQVNVDEKAYERLFERLERDAEPVVVDGEVLNGYEP